MIRGNLSLVELVNEGRHGKKQSLFEFADVMYCTLREEAFKEFQGRHRPVENSFREWFYSKLSQFISILLFDNIEVIGNEKGKWVNKWTDFPVEEGLSITKFSGDCVQPDEIERALEPAYNALRHRHGLAQAVGERPKYRLKAVQEWLARFRRQCGPPRSDAGELDKE